MARLVDEGIPPSVAAERVSGDSVVRAARPVQVLVDAGRQLVQAGSALDRRMLMAEVDRAFGSADFEEVADGWLMPALRDVGDAWESGRLDVAGEHFISQVIRGRLLLALDSSREPIDDGVRMVAAQAEGVRHDLGLLSFSVVARRQGIDVTFLGVDTPTPDVVAALERSQAHWLVTSVGREAEIEPTKAMVAAVLEAVPGVRIGVGGGRQDEIVDGRDEVVALGHEMWPAAERLALSGRAPSPPQDPVSR